MSCDNNFYVAKLSVISFTNRMNMTADKTLFETNLIQFSPTVDKQNRILSMFSATIVFDDDRLTELAVNKSIEFHIERTQLYEIILQSYLFLGFPRMLQAATVLQKVLPLQAENNFDFLSENKLAQWYKDGEKVCKKVYQDKFEPLKNKVLEFAPDIYHWMISEGYGKVLSRDLLPLVTRELSIVSFLTMENRKRQLHSHILGAVNVGASQKQVKVVIDDIGLSAGDGYSTALKIIDGLKE